jgi:hypothetical protein
MEPLDTMEEHLNKLDVMANKLNAIETIFL